MFENLFIDFKNKIVEKVKQFIQEASDGNNTFYIEESVYLKEDVAYDYTSVYKEPFFVTSLEVNKKGEVVVNYDDDEENFQKNLIDFDLDDIKSILDEINIVK